jgi:putative DNA primase/helicase
MNVMDRGFSHDATLDPESNCTLEMYATAKALPVDFLSSLGLATTANPHAPRRMALAIPYRNTDGILHRKRIRAGLIRSNVGQDRRMLWDQQPEGHGTILYGLDRLPTRGTIILTEGESDAHTLWLHGFAALGVPGATHFKPERDDRYLKDRDVVVLMESDEGGIALLRALSISQERARIRVAMLKGFKDASEMHMACPERFKNRIERAIGRAVPLERLLKNVPELDRRPASSPAGLPRGYRRRPDGAIEHLDGEDKEGELQWRWLCSPIEFLAVTRDQDQHAWGLLLHIKTPDGHWHQWAMPLRLLSEAGAELGGALRDLGATFAIGPRAKNALLNLLNSAMPEKRACCVPHVGWHGRAFVLPEQAFGDTEGQLVVFQPTTPLKHAYRVSGTLEAWQGMARLAVGNSRLVFLLSTAFAGPLLQLIGVEGGGVHLVGSSTVGKTTGLKVAGSIWGGGGLNGYIRTWRATDNALEGTAVAHCDTLLCLDEMAEVDSRTAFRTAYMLPNGQGKARAGRSGDVRPSAEWRVLFVSTGEIGLANKIAEDGRRATAGQEVRIVDVPADAGAGLGLFQDLHGYNRPQDFADALNHAAAENYGHASRLYIERLTQDLEVAREAIRQSMESWTREHCREGDGQVRRVARRFALIAAAGEFATAMGILPWMKGEADRGVARCFEDWLAQRGGTEPSEERRGIDHLRAFIAKHGASRFQPMTTPDAQIRDRAGFKEDGTQGTSYYFFPESFREACCGLDPGTVARALATRGMLEQGNDKPSKLKRLPGFEAPCRVYIVTPALFREQF